MTIPAIHFEAKKHAYRQTQDGVVVSFVVHPNDLNAGFAVAPLGTRYMVALAEIGDDGEPISPEASIPESAAIVGADDAGAPPQKQPAAASVETKREYTLANRVGMTCADKAFWRWIDDQRGTAPGLTDAEDAARWVRRRCGVESRSEIKPGTDAAKAWGHIASQFEQATGRMAEAR